jgi:hypothetical protein
MFGSRSAILVAMPAISELGFGLRLGVRLRHALPFSEHDLRGENRSPLFRIMLLASLLPVC